MRQVPAEGPGTPGRGFGRRGADAMTNNLSAILILAGVPLVVTALAYFLLHGRLGFFWIFLLAYLVACAVYTGIVWMSPGGFSGFGGISTLITWVAFLPYTLLIAFLCRLVAR
jgi:hypothetical protein